MLAKTPYHWEAPTSDFTSESWAERMKKKEKFGSWRKTKKIKGPEEERRVEATGTVGLMKKLDSC